MIVDDSCMIVESYTIILHLYWYSMDVFEIMMVWQ